MVCQLFKISDQNIFRKFSSSYKIYREVFDSGLFGLEIRDLSAGTADEIFKIILEENEICYRKHPENQLNDIFIPGSMNQLKKFARRVISIGNEDAGYKILSTINNFENYNRIKYKLGKKDFNFNYPSIMGILNVTPDSFSDGGLFQNCEKAVQHGLEMLDSGADILDIGGESSRPGAQPVNENEEIRRIIPVIEGILKERPDTIISVDTTKSKVAKEALERGVVIINDISGLTFDPGLVDVINSYKASVVIMHMKGTPSDMQKNPSYGNLIQEVYDFLGKQSQIAAKGGIKNIFIDPGIGFGKTAEHNFELIKRLEDFKSLGYPLLVGVSRKSFIGKFLDLDVTMRDTATAVIETAAILNGARIIRTHNVSYCSYITKIAPNIL